MVIWESSRGSRRVGEWASLLDKLEDAGIKVHVATHGRTYDPANHRDRRTLMEDAVDSEYESGKASTRIKRALTANAANGKPHGQIPYGYRREYDVLPNGRRVLVAQVPDEREAPVVRELFDRLRQGHSLRSIARDFEQRGIRGRSCPESCTRDHEHRVGKVHRANLLAALWQLSIDGIVTARRDPSDQRIIRYATAGQP